MVELLHRRARLRPHPATRAASHPVSGKESEAQHSTTTQHRHDHSVDEVTEYCGATTLAPSYIRCTFDIVAQLEPPDLSVMRRILGILAAHVTHSPLKPALGPVHRAQHILWQYFYCHYLAKGDSVASTRRVDQPTTFLAYSPVQHSTTSHYHPWTQECS